MRNRHDEDEQSAALLHLSASQLAMKKLQKLVQ
jgi:hypothetical protein